MDSHIRVTLSERSLEGDEETERRVVAQGEGLSTDTAL